MEGERFAANTVSLLPELPFPRISAKALVKERLGDWLGVDDGDCEWLVDCDVTEIDWLGVPNEFSGLTFQEGPDGVDDLGEARRLGEAFRLEGDCFFDLPFPFVRGCDFPGDLDLDSK